MKGRTIRLYLVDGVPTGILTAEIINWTGKVILVPRSQLAELALRPEAKRTGFYCLVGPDPEFPSRDRVYVGEGDNVLFRLTSHEKDETKDFWTRAVVVISKDENLTKSHGRYLESRVIELIRASDRASLSNGTNPDPNPLPEADIADMEFFIEQVQIIFPVLGFAFLQPKPVYVAGLTSGGEQSPRFVMKDVGTNATAVEIGGEFVVLKGSTARKVGVDSWVSYRDLRDQLVSDGKIVIRSDPDYYVFNEDVAFSSPSAAATVVAARNTNGRIHWKVENSGQTYAEWSDSKLPKLQEQESVDGE